MPDTFEIATEAPVTEYVSAQPVTFPVLMVDDLLPWCSEVKAEWKRGGEARLRSQKMGDYEAWRARHYLDNLEVTLDDLVARVRTPAGGKRVLLLSLAKAGRPEAEAKAIADAVPPYRLANLAEAVSRLVPPPIPMPSGGGGPSPNAGAGGDAGGEQTGST